ncbi:MAG: CotH kinase family protein [Verrucomicrobiales bacterium]|nr:CotH kinase family protein [Verrucomicrobiales bacterium]
MNHTLPPRLTLRGVALVALTALALLTRPAHAQPPGARGQGQGGGGRTGGPGGAGQDTKLVKQFDKNGDKRLDTAERQAAREFLKQEVAAGRGPRRPGPRGGRNEPAAPVEAGRKLSPADVKSIPDAPLYDLAHLRTFFFEFESTDWENELNAFYHTDVDVPAKLTVDGKTYPQVGVHFRGASSFFTVGEGRKRSLNIAVDHADPAQRLGGYRTLNLLNSHTDPTFLRTVLYYEVANDLIPCPRANYVRVVINGESWGIFVNAQQVNADFVQERFQAPAKARWKVPGSPRGNGGLGYLGDDVAPYQRIYEIKSKDDPKSWEPLIRLCRTLTQTPLEQLEAALEPMLDLDGTLKFLALENTLVNCDGYWIRSSDFHLLLDANGRFHLVPHDANETFRLPEGPGMPRGEGASGVKLHPLVGSEDPNKPLLHRLLAVPALKARYFGHVRALTEKWLDWNRIGPLATRYQALIADEVTADTRRLYPAEAFRRGLTEDTEEASFRGPSRSISIKGFVEQRREYLLGLPEIRDAVLPAKP